MMVVMAVMAADLHLSATLLDLGPFVKFSALSPPFCGVRAQALAATRRWEQDKAMLKMRRAPVLVLALLLLPAACLGGPAKQSAPPQQKPAVRPEDRVDLNRATLDQLMKVPGMTRTWAERIMRFRPYRSKQDLVEQGVLPGDVYNRIRDYVIAHRDPD